jgi:hypothetical protein
MCVLRKNIFLLDDEPRCESLSTHPTKMYRVAEEKSIRALGTNHVAA